MAVGPLELYNTQRMSIPFSKIMSRWLPLIGFGGSRAYWERRYKLGGDSGTGSYGKASRYKAEVLNTFVAKHGISSIIEFGCVDGHQIYLAKYPSYLGVDVSADALERCRKIFSRDSQKSFITLDEYNRQSADLALSLDVIYHLVEDEVYWQYLAVLFSSAKRFVVIYSTSADQPSDQLPHVRHRPVEKDIAARFPEFNRMADEERGIPPPVVYSSNMPTRFLIYCR